MWLDAGDVAAGVLDDAAPIAPLVEFECWARTGTRADKVDGYVTTFQLAAEAAAIAGFAHKRFFGDGGH
jgi:hypothetical protein